MYLKCILEFFESILGVFKSTPDIVNNLKCISVFLNWFLTFLNRFYIQIPINICNFHIRRPICGSRKSDEFSNRLQHIICSSYRLLSPTILFIIRILSLLATEFRMLSLLLIFWRFLAALRIVWWKFNAALWLLDTKQCLFSSLLSHSSYLCPMFYRFLMHGSEGKWEFLILNSVLPFIRFPKTYN